MASATVNGASLVANYNNKTSATGGSGGGGSVSPTSGIGDDEQMSRYTNINLNNNNNNVEERWSRDSNDGGGGGGNRKRSASVSYIADDDINPPSSSSTSAAAAAAAKSSKKRRKQSNPVRLATCSSRGSVDKMAIEDEYRDNVLANSGNVRVSSSSVTNPDDFDSPVEDEGLVEEGEMTSSVSQQQQQQLRAIVKVMEEEQERARAEEDDEDEFDDGRVHRCPHCNVLFDVKEHLNRHVEEEHVQKILERQLQQQNQKNFASGSGGGGVGGANECKRNANSPFDLSTASSSSVSANFPRFDGRHSNSSSSDTSLTEENKLFHHSMGGGATGHHSLHHHQQQQSPHHQQQQQHQSNAPSKDLPPASLMALSAFGAAPFLIPVLPSSSSGAPLLQRGSAIPNSMASGSSMGGVGGNGSCSTLTRIFNPEAFCELCNKEFCNKYFLKTHKANKHGVYSLDTLTTGSQTTPTSTITSSSSHPSSFSPSNNTNIISMNLNNSGGSGQINNGGNGSGGGGGGGLVGGNIMNNNNNNNGNRHQRRSGSGMGSGSSPPLSMDGLQTPPAGLRENQLNMGPLLSTSAAVSLGMLSNKMLPVMNPEAFCDICQKEFCNKYFLKKHRQKIHGIQDPPSLNPSGSNNPPVTSSASSLVSAAAVANSISALVDSIAAVAAANNTTPSELVNLHNSTFGQGGGGSHHHHPIPPSDLFYEYSARDLSAKIAAATQAASKHSIQNLMGAAGGGAKTNSNAGSPSNGANVTTSGSTSGGADTSPLPLFISGQMNNNGGSGGAGGSTSPSGESGRWIPGCITVAGHVFTPERLREMGVINVDAFCEICCKEFCNKYFLRTHKMNKHGVGVAPGEFPVPPTTTTTSGNVLIKSPSSTSHSHMGQPTHHTSLSSSSSSQDKQQQPLSLVMDKDGCQTQQLMASLQDENSGRKSINSPGSNHSGSSYGRSTLMAANLVSVQLERPPSSPLPLDSTQETGNVSQDLICEVCSRPFSSTYLLKMHKFYFHNSSMAAAAAALGAGADVTSSLIEEHIAVAEAMRRRCSSDGGSSISGKSGNQTPNSVQETGSGPINDELQKLQSMIRELNTSPGANQALKDCNSEVRCSVCLKEMKNKYFLRAHMMNEHGELHNEDVDASPPDCFNVSLKNEPEDYSDGGDRATPSNKSANVTTSANDPESTFCDFCGKDMCSKYFLRAHQLTAHAHEIQIKQEINPLNLNQMLLPVHPDRIKSENNAAAAAAAAAVGALNLAAISQHHHQQQMSSMMVSPSPMTSSSQDQRSNVTGRNFCEICNKELCNKYFMKTHMLKMHGINVDDKIHSGGVNGATIGGVMCDICQKELCSKYFLKVHKQNTHGCYEESPPISKENYVAAAAAAAVAAAQQQQQQQHQQQQQQQQQHQQQLDAMQSQLSNDGYASDGVTTTTSSNGNRYFSHYTEVCPLCDRRFKSIKWLKTHVINDHADLAKDSGLAELLATESYLASTGDFSPPPPPLTNNNNHRLPLLQQQRHSMQQQQRNLSSPRDYLNESISPSKGSSKSPNSFLAHHYHSISRHPNAATNDDGDVTSSVTAATTTTTTATTTSAATTAIFQADELGSTGAALATIATAGTSASGGVGNGGCGVNDGGGGGGGSGEGGGGLREGNEHKRSILSMYSLHHHRPRANAGVIRKPITTTTTTGSGGATTRIYHCSYCTYSTRWLSNLYAHEKRHTGLSNEGEKRFSCRVCHRAYRYNHSLQRHLVSHKTTGILFKHVMNSSSNNNHVFSSNSALSQLISSSNQQRNMKAEAELDNKELMNRGGIQQQQQQHQQQSLIQFGNNNCGGMDANNLTSGSKMCKAPIRIKKYRCSKCGAKYRSREQCLEHIHMNHSNIRGIRRRLILDNNVTTTSTSANNNNKIAAAASRTAGGSGGGGELQCPGCDFSCLSNEAMVMHIHRQHQEEAAETEVDQPAFEFDVRKLKNQHQNYSQYNEVETAEMSSPQQQQQQQQPQLPMTYAVPQAPPTAGSFIMQPFLITQQQQQQQQQSQSPQPAVGDSPSETTVTASVVTASGSTSPSNVTTTNSGNGKELKSHNSIPTTFVPSLVYLPVSRKVNDTVTVTFNLIPA